MNENQLPMADPAVMVIDDDDHFREVIALLLSRRGYRVEPCRDASEALTQLENGSTPDLILLDLMMPRMDGWEFRVEQKRKPQWANIPLVALTADTSAKAAAIDADAILTKPIEDRELIDTVEKLLSKSRQHQGSKASASDVDWLGSLGALVASIAHEVNDPLAFMVGNLELAQRMASDLETRVRGPEAFSMVGLRQLLARTQRGAERIAEVMRGAATFSRASADSLVFVDVREVLDASIRMASNEIRHCARLERAYDAVPGVLGNPAKLGQVFLYLLLSVARSLDGGSPGDHVLRVALCSGADHVTVTISGARAASPGAKAGAFDAPPRARPSGARIGPDLSASRALVESMGGTIEVVDDPSNGAIVQVTLPNRGFSEVSEGTRASKLDARVTRRRPSVLVVDDEPMMCDMIAAVLAGNYDVATVSDPRAALASMLEGSFDVILCDLMMPDLSGMDMYERIAEERPDLTQRIIFLSAGVFTERARKFLATTRRPQVYKPFRREELIDVIEANLAPKH
jgi:CheY-like chemotaxis protein